MESEERTPLVKHPLQDLDIDRLLSEKLGDFGTYQKFIYLLICIPSGLTAAITMASVFTSDTPLHRCLVPGCDSPLVPRYDDAYLFGYSNFTLPASEPCQVYLSKDNTSCSSNTFTQTTGPCSQLLYSTQDLSSTIVSQWGLVCGQEWRVPLAQSIFFGGVLAGAAIFGPLGDYLGRKTTFLVSLVQTLVCGIAAALAPTYNMYVALQFLTGMGQLGVFQAAYILGIELVGRSKRVFCGVVIEFFFVLGEVLLALVAWWLRDWRHIQLATILPGLALLAYFFLLPKSPRWLLQRRRYKEAQHELEKLAKGNSVTMPPDWELRQFTEQTVASSSSSSSESLLDLVRRPRMLGRLLNVFFNWIVITMVYYGLTMNSGSLVGDIFFNFALQALTEAPGYLLALLGMTYIGRRVTMAVSLFIGGVACLTSSLLPVGVSPVLSTCLFLLGKFGASAAFGTAYLYTSELFPTSVRNACVGLSSMCGRFGAIVSPYVARLGLLTGVGWLPMAVFAGAAITSGLLTLVLPETLGKPLPRSLSEAESIGIKVVPVREGDQEE